MRPETGVQRALFLPLKNVASTTLPDRVHSVPNWEASIPIEFWTVLPTLAFVLSNRIISHYKLALFSKQLLIIKNVDQQND